MVQRFDRKWSKDNSWLIRLPQEDMCQALGVHPANKYEIDGGPGIYPVMDLLQGSSRPGQDRRTFMKSQILFWLLAAIDGHAKNFSIFLLPKGGFELTPLYDVISAHPLVATGQIASQKLRMAMAAKGKNKHYSWQHIQYRHWLSTAKASIFQVSDIKTIIDELLDSMEDVINGVSDQLPRDFPDRVAQPIFHGMKQARDRLIRSKTAQA